MFPSHIVYLMFYSCSWKPNYYSLRISTMPEFCNKQSVRNVPANQRVEIKDSTTIVTSPLQQFYIVHVKVISKV